MTRSHRCTPALVRIFGICLSVSVGCGGAGAGGSMGGAGTNGGAGTTSAAGTNGGAGTTSAAGTNGGAGMGAAGTGGGGGTAGAVGAVGAAGHAGAAGGAGAAGDAGDAGAARGAGAGGGAGAAGAGGATATTACGDPALVWKTGSKTNFTSYPAPGSAECIQYSGCMYEGEFAGCNQTETLAWVMAHNIVAAFPDFNALKLHDLCLKSSTGKTIVVTVLDTCGDSDCNGCCTQNKGSADELIDVESFTDMRWGVPDGRIQWADLGATKTSGCK